MLFPVGRHRFRVSARGGGAGREAGRDRPAALDQQGGPAGTVRAQRRAVRTGWMVFRSRGTGGRSRRGRRAASSSGAARASMAAAHASACRSVPGASCGASTGGVFSVTGSVMIQSQADRSAGRASWPQSSETAFRRSRSGTSRARARVSPRHVCNRRGHMAVLARVRSRARAVAPGRPQSTFPEQPIN